MPAVLVGQGGAEAVMVLELVVPLETLVEDPREIDEL